MRSGLALRDAYRAGELSPVEVARETLARIEAVDPRLNAFVTVTADLALEQAAAAERAYADGGAGPLAGIPVSIKDLVDVAGIRTTLGSLVHRDRVAEADAPLVARIRSAGGVIVGKTTTSEYGWKGESGNRVNGPAHNPWRHGLTAGGSSGGAAAAVAAGLGAMAQGGDGAGSIRIPAGFCGVVGMKPTTGLVPAASRSGLSSQGPIARTVADAALLLDVMAGTTTLDGIDGGVAGVRTAWSADLGFAAVEGDVVAIAAAAARRLPELGLEVEDADPPGGDPWPIVDAIWAWNQAEGEDPALSDLADPGRWAVVERGLRMTAADHDAAHARRREFTAAVDGFFADIDLLVTPALPCPPFRAGADQPGWVGGRPTEYLSWTAFTYPFNVTGQPAATVPCGRTEDGLPVGLQLIGRRGEDELVLRAARAFEQAFPWSYDGMDLV
ncbi:MAG TPA: amidase family protein [Gaiellales bacterium]|nr:amidase family protein [Gaiellales bacterium]